MLGALCFVSPRAGTRLKSCWNMLQHWPAISHIGTFRSSGCKMSCLLVPAALSKGWHLICFLYRANLGSLGMVVMVDTIYDASANWSICTSHPLQHSFFHSKCLAPHFDPCCPFLHESTPRAPIGPADTILSFQCFLSLGEPILPIIPGLGQRVLHVFLLIAVLPKYIW